MLFFYIVVPVVLIKSSCLVIQLLHVFGNVTLFLSVSNMLLEILLVRRLVVYLLLEVFYDSCNFYWDQTAAPLAQTAAVNVKFYIVKSFSLCFVSL